MTSEMGTYKYHHHHTLDVHFSFDLANVWPIGHFR
jgi:hypothetical protein